MTKKSLKIYIKQKMTGYQGSKSNMHLAYEKPTMNRKKIIWDIFKNGFINSLNNLSSRLTSFFLIFLSGQIKRSKLIVSALGTANLFVRIIADIGFGFSSGLSVIAGRCYGLSDYVGLERFLWMTYTCVNAWSGILSLY